MPHGNTTPRGASVARSGRRMQMRGMGENQDEELAELQRRFNMLEDEARGGAMLDRSGPSTTTPRATLRGQRERAVASAVRADNESELNKLDEQITTLRRKHDELAHANMDKRRELEKLTDRLQDLSKEAQMPSPTTTRR